MSRSSLALLSTLVVLTLLAPLANAQLGGGGKLEITDLAPHVYSNQTTQPIKFHVALTLNRGTCVGGSAQFPIQLAVVKTAQTGNATLTVEVQPATLNFQVPATDTLQGNYANGADAIILVKPGLVRENVTATLKVTATGGSVTCTLPTGMAPGALSAEGTSMAHFTPVSDEVANGTAQALPGIELPALLVLVVLAAFAARRKA